jgi:superfamily II RNA helicase
LTQLYNIIGSKIKILPFQQNVINRVENEKSVIVCMPTNSGKTVVAYNYANLDESDPDNRIIFTAPTKAVSAERYAELAKQGLDVSLITGDVRMDDGNPILCLTNEIYQNEFCKRKATVIIDEFHYIFHEPERARSYIEGIYNTNPESKIMLMSATIDNPENLSLWLNNLTNRNFTVATSNQRLVPLQFNKKGIKCKEVRDSIVFCFSRRNIQKVINKLIRTRRKSSDRLIREMAELSTKYKVEFLPEWEYGLSRYNGKLLPKVKDMVVYLFRHGYIDTVVGTDSLALGVNLPAKQVIIAETWTPTGDHLPPSKFRQLCGRAGRFGQEKIGIATYLIDSPIATHDGIRYNLGDDFKRLVERKLEKTRILVEPDYKAIINGKYIEEEAEDILKFTYNPPTERTIETEIEKVKTVDITIRNIIAEYNELLNENEKSIFIDLLTKYYLQEWELEKNAYMTWSATKMISENGGIDVDKIIEKTKLDNSGSPGEFLYEILLVNKWLKAIRLDDNYRTKNYGKLIETVNDLDITVFNPSERLI